MEELSLLQAVILGAVQGATEFLPVSSSGHLVLGQALLGVKLGGESLLAFNICLHFGTLLAILVVFWRDLVAIFHSVISLKLNGKEAAQDDVFEQEALSPSQGKRLFWFIFLGTIPAGTIGIGFKDFFTALAADPLSASYMLIVTGLILFGTRFVKTGNIRIANLRFWQVFGIGIAQALAIVPGISRSGSTIAAALYLGINRELAARFSFLLAIPAIAGATILGLDDLRYFRKEDLIAILAGTIVAFIVGLFCIKWLLHIVRRGKLAWFAVYCWVVGILGLVFFS